MISNRRPPLTPRAQESLETIASELPSEGELTYEHAYTILKDREELEQPATGAIFGNWVVVLLASPRIERRSTCLGISEL